VGLDGDLRRAADTAVAYATEGEELVGIVPAEPASGVRFYVCAYGGEEESTWLVLDATCVPVEERALVRDAVSIAALCEVAEEAAGIEPDGPRLASPAYLDELGAKAGAELGGAVKGSTGSVDELLRDVERGYKRPLS
jgi:hypothetical protein